jgi:hypothetical protein
MIPLFSFINPTVTLLNFLPGQCDSSAIST